MVGCSFKFLSIFERTIESTQLARRLPHRAPDLRFGIGAASVYRDVCVTLKSAVNCAETGCAEIRRMVKKALWRTLITGLRGHKAVRNGKSPRRIPASRGTRSRQCHGRGVPSGHSQNFHVRKWPDNRFEAPIDS